LLLDAKISIPRPNGADMVVSMRTVEHRLVRLYRKHQEQRAKGGYQVIDAQKSSSTQSRNYSAHISNLANLVKDHGRKYYSNLKREMSTDLQLIQKEILREWWSIDVPAEKAISYTRNHIIAHICRLAPSQRHYRQLYKGFE